MSERQVEGDLFVSEKQLICWLPSTYLGYCHPKVTLIVFVVSPGISSEPMLGSFRRDDSDEGSIANHLDEVECYTRPQLSQ